MAMIDDLIAFDPPDANIKPLYEEPLKCRIISCSAATRSTRTTCGAGHLIMINRLAIDLIGMYKEKKEDPLIPLETIQVDRLRLPADALDPKHEDGGAPGGPTTLVCDIFTLPAGRRKSIILRTAQMTTIASPGGLP